jgi:hypothetical protein
MNVISRRLASAMLAVMPSSEKLGKYQAIWQGQTLFAICHQLRRFSAALS